MRATRGKSFAACTHTHIVCFALSRRGAARRELLTAPGIVQTFSIYLESIGNYVGEATVEFLDSSATICNFGQIDRVVCTEFLAALAIR